MSGSSSQTFFNPSLAVSDFLQRLRTAKNPRFPQPQWRQCLSQICELDDARRLVEHYRNVDAIQFRTVNVSYHEYLTGNGQPKMNGRELHLSVADEQPPGVYERYRQRRRTYQRNRQAAKKAAALVVE